jgi:hypothetical protein
MPINIYFAVTPRNVDQKELRTVAETKVPGPEEVKSYPLVVSRSLQSFFRDAEEVPINTDANTDRNSEKERNPLLGSGSISRIDLAGPFLREEEERNNKVTTREAHNTSADILTEELGQTTARGSIYAPPPLRQNKSLLDQQQSSKTDIPNNNHNTESVETSTIPNTTAAPVEPNPYVPPLLSKSGAKLASTSASVSLEQLISSTTAVTEHGDVNLDAGSRVVASPTSVNVPATPGRKSSKKSDSDKGSIRSSRSSSRSTTPTSTSSSNNVNNNNTRGLAGSLFGSKSSLSRKITMPIMSSVFGGGAGSAKDLTDNPTTATSATNSNDMSTNLAPSISQQMIGVPQPLPGPSITSSSPSLAKPLNGEPIVARAMKLPLLGQNDNVEIEQTTAINQVKNHQQEYQVPVEVDHPMRPHNNEDTPAELLTAALEEHRKDSDSAFSSTVSLPSWMIRDNLATSVGVLATVPDTSRPTSPATSPSSNIPPTSSVPGASPSNFTLGEHFNSVPTNSLSNTTGGLSAASPTGSNLVPPLRGRLPAIGREKLAIIGSTAGGGAASAASGYSSTSTTPIPPPTPLGIATDAASTTQANERTLGGSRYSVASNSNDTLSGRGGLSKESIEKQ